MLSRRRSRRATGITLIELLIVMGLVGILASIAANVYGEALRKARNTRAVTDIRTIQNRLFDREVQGSLPETLVEIGWGDRLDPWGNPYQYVNFELAMKGKGGGGIAGIARKDRFLVPINTTYDLFSMGPDGDSGKPLTAAASRDDIIRASDGGFIGIAEEF